MTSKTHFMTLTQRVVRIKGSDENRPGVIAGFGMIKDWCRRKSWR
jgi:hypothetical protein